MSLPLRADWSLTQPFKPVSDQKPSAIVRVMEDFMDNCSGTQKSQYGLGGFALKVMTAELDAVYLSYMMLGHTKFESDVPAQKTAGAFNRGDCFNHGMLDKLFAPYVTARAYDGNLLHTVKDCTKLLFAKVDLITSFRSFLLIGDDGLFQDSLVRVFVFDSDGARMQLFPDKTGDFYSFESVTAAVEALAERSLNILLPILLGLDDKKGYHGVGDGTGNYGPVSTDKIFKYRHARLAPQAALRCLGPSPRIFDGGKPTWTGRVAPHRERRCGSRRFRPSRGVRARPILRARAVPTPSGRRGVRPWFRSHFSKLKTRRGVSAVKRQAWTASENRYNRAQRFARDSDGRPASITVFMGVCTNSRNSVVGAPSWDDL